MDILAFLDLVESSAVVGPVWHGSPHSFDEFRPGPARKLEMLSFGFHFFSDRAVAERYAFGDLRRKKTSGVLYEAKLSYTKQLDIERVVKKGEVLWSMVEELAPRMRHFTLDGVKACWLRNVLDGVPPARTEVVLRQWGFDLVKYKAIIRFLSGSSPNEAAAYIALNSSQINVVAKHLE